MKVFSKIWVKVMPGKNRLVLPVPTGRVKGQNTSILLRDASVAVPRATDTVPDGRRAWSDNCNELSRIVQGGGNVKVLTKEKSQVLADRNGWSIEYARGYVDGETCRQRARKPSKYQMIGIDDYSLGFRAGYYERGDEAARSTKKRVSQLSVD